MTLSLKLTTRPFPLSVGLTRLLNRWSPLKCMSSLFLVDVIHRNLRQTKSAKSMKEFPSTRKETGRLLSRVPMCLGSGGNSVSLLPPPRRTEVTLQISIHDFLTLSTLEVMVQARPISNLRISATPLSFRKLTRSNGKQTRAVEFLHLPSSRQLTKSKTWASSTWRRVFSFRRPIQRVS